MFRLKTLKMFTPTAQSIRRKNINTRDGEGGGNVRNVQNIPLSNPDLIFSRIQIQFHVKVKQNKNRGRIRFRFFLMVESGN